MKFEYAPTAGVERHRAVADDFMRRIFEMEPEEYMISDESMLIDFASFADEAEMPPIRAKVESVYGDVVEKDTDYLVTILQRIASK